MTDNTIVFIQILNSQKPEKKYVARFFNRNRDIIKQTHFGSKYSVTYNEDNDEEAKENYIARHSGNEDWNNPTTPGALSRWLLWNRRSLSASFKNFLKKFELKEY